MTARQWDDLLYNLGLSGQDWYYVNPTKDAYLSWKIKEEITQRWGTENWGPITEEKLKELLSRTNLSESDQHLITTVLHHLASPEQFPLPPLPKIEAIRFFTKASGRS